MPEPWMHTMLQQLVEASCMVHALAASPGMPAAVAASVQGNSVKKNTRGFGHTATLAT